MAKFGERSLSRLSTCDDRLQQLMKRVVEIMDCTVLCGHRSQVEQELAYVNKASTKRWPDSRHNTLPSMAVDVAPYPIPKDWHPFNFLLLAGVVKAEAHHLGLHIRFGGDWNENDDIMDNRFNDFVHFEVLG